MCADTRHVSDRGRRACSRKSRPQKPYVSFSLFLFPHFFVVCPLYLSTYPPVSSYPFLSLSVTARSSHSASLAFFSLSLALTPSPRRPVDCVIPFLFIPTAYGSPWNRCLWIFVTGAQVYVVCYDQRKAIITGERRTIGRQRR